MEISAGTSRLWKHNTSGIDGMENTLKVNSPSNLLNENGGESLRSKLFVYAKEVDLYAF